jgi:predicted Zn-dependent protease with MMP-like domain
MHVTSRDFESLVEQALAELPPQFASLLDNIAIVVEDEPSDDDLDVLGDDADEHDELLGIYRGVALTQRTHDMLPLLPDQIAIFRGPILRIAASRREVIEEVRDTVIHELGHYFGLHDDEMVF